MKNALQKIKPSLAPGCGPGRELGALLKSLRCDQRGAILILFALMMPVLLGVIGMGVEVGFWFSKHRDLQSAADAAALAGGYEVYESRSSQTKTVADREAGNNGWSTTTGTSIINNSQYNGSYPTGAYTSNYSTDSNAVEVFLTQTVDRMFSGWFMGNDVTLNAVAVATLVGDDNVACVLALGAGNPAQALLASGSLSVTMSGCSAATNSTDPNAVFAKPGLSVDCIYSAGGGSGSPTTTQCSGIQSNQLTTEDPYEAAVTKPIASDFSACTTYAQPSPPADDGLSPDVYCGLTYTNNGHTLTLSSGTYYIDRGDLFIASGASIDATAGVTFVFGDSTGAGDCGGVTVQGASSIDITAPTSGNFSGLAFYRNSECDSGADITFSGSINSTIIGAIYNPSAGIVMSGSGTVGSTCLQVIGDTVTFTGNSTLGSSCGSAGTLTVSTGSKVSLVE
ncbi:MAG: pilus assembly protein [Rhodospirillales bacterium]|nr:pilus assembly protein [Rhodospirillales bacterium]